MELKREKHIIDAEGQAVGRLATKIATFLIGKHKPSFVPNIDAGDFVTVKNADKLKFTGKKLEQKVFRHHTMRPGGLKEVKVVDVFKKNPGEVVKHAVYGMLPKNKHRVNRIKRLVIE
ncbi:MAG: Ribosomal protein L13 [uncultured bacterium]|nr:MAG: Ribosomal protein L13 [uncultured bacterium]HBD05586.1 50S ribosomal protein L13 [Candidatus Uhrbacteria bacterium]